MKKYKGVIVPAITPLTSGFKLDSVAIEKMFANFETHHVSAFILGTTGEAASLPLALKQEFLLQAVKYKPKDSLLYAGISSNCVEESIEMAMRCGHAGIDVAVATVPSYYSLTEGQVKQYFEHLANNSPVPVIIYNIPATTHTSLSLSVLDELSHHPNIVGAKDSERSDERLQASIDMWKDRDDFSHFVGWAARSAYALLAGSDGIIPSSGNLYPGVYDELITAAAKGDKEHAMEMQRLSDEIGDLYQKGHTLGESLWAPKSLMHELNICLPVVMPPLQPVDGFSSRLSAFSDQLSAVSHRQSAVSDYLSAGGHQPSSSADR